MKMSIGSFRKGNVIVRRLKEKKSALLHPDIPECELPTQDKDSANSVYLTNCIAEIRAKGNTQLREEKQAYNNEIEKIESKPHRLVTLCTIAVIVFAALLAYFITCLVTDQVWALLAAAIVCLLGYILSGIVHEYIYLIFLRKKAEKLTDVADRHKAALSSLSDKLKAEVDSVKEDYFSKVVDAQFKYGKQNNGIGVLADWCCGQLMHTIRQGDHRKFQDRIYAQIHYVVNFDRVALTSMVFDPKTTALGETFTPKEVLAETVFILQENCIYNMSSDLFTLTGCAQALCSHITEKMNDVLSENGYAPDASYEFESNDNSVTLKINVSNPMFVPFQDM